MADTITSAQMRALEQAAIESGQVTGFQLMERAGQGVVEAVFEEWPELGTDERRAVVLCGPGNNGGDGFVVARLLRDRGWRVEVYLYGDAAKLPQDARVNYERCSDVETVIQYKDEEFWLPCEKTNNDSLLIDALFGIGLSRPLHLNSFSWTALMCAAESRRMNSADWPSARVVVVDVPSGMNADTGRFPRPYPVPFDFECAAANLTVTFHQLKPGHVLAEGPAACGKIVVKDIGL